MVEERRNQTSNDKVRICYRCRRKVYPSNVEGYEYQCFIHDEDLYGIETLEISVEEYLQMIAKRLHCSVQEAKKIDAAYDKYVYDCIRNDYYPMKMEKFAKGAFEKSRDRG